MASKRRPTLSELRVGIFVVILCAILAIAIFTIGSEVGVLEESFVAKTYLNNVSGLKPGDVVLLGGIEVGNVSQVRMSTSDSDMPQTQDNLRTRRELADLQRDLVTEQSGLPLVEQDVLRIQADYNDAVTTSGADSAEAIEIEGRLDQARRVLARQRRRVLDVQGKIQRAHGNLQNIEVYMNVAAQYRGWIKADSYISLGSIGLLGDKFIEISIGRTGQAAAVIEEDVDTLFGTSSREVVFITGQRQTGFQELITGANDILTNFETLSEKLQDAMDQFQEGEGTVGKFFSDPTFYDNLNGVVASAKEAADEASNMLRSITEGGGTIPSLIQKSDVHDSVLSAVDAFNKTMAEVNAGQGTLGKFVKDPALYDKADKTVANLEEITQRMAAGEGTLGKLSTDDQLYADLRKSLDELSGLLADIKSGKGTLGRLTTDEQLYQNLNEATSEIVKLLYDFRQDPKRFLTVKVEIF